MAGHGEVLKKDVSRVVRYAEVLAKDTDPRSRIKYAKQLAWFIFSMG